MYEHSPEVFTADTTTLIYLAVVIALSALAYSLRKKPSTDFKIDNALTTLTTRGSWLQLIIGRRRVAPVFAWAGDRVVEQEKIGGGKGGGGGGSSYVYYESGWHLLCVGPATRLHAIYQNGVALWEGPIDRFNTPSGTQIETTEGSFRVYWGEASQPVNDHLADPERIGIASRWPYICSILWIKKKLGAAARWSQLEYDVVAEDVGSDLEQSAPLLEASAPDGHDRGVNYAHAMYQILTGISPHGVGAPPDAFDFGWLEILGKLCRDEHTPVSIIASDGRSCTEIMSEIAQEHGFFVTQMGEVIGFLPLRPPEGAVPEFDWDTVSAPNPEQESMQLESEADQVVYLFPDVTKNFKPHDIALRDDGESRSTNRRDPQEVGLTTVIDLKTAQKVGSRRQNETFGGRDLIKFKVGFTSRVLQPGIPFKVAGTLYRVNSRVIKTDEGFTDLNVFLDQFSDTPNDWDPGDQTIEPPSSTPAEDIAVNVLEVPYSISLGVCQIAVLRVRGSHSTASADIHVSRFGITYQRAGSQPLWASGGRLQAPLPKDRLSYLDGADAPVITEFNDDVLNARDLSGDRQSHFGGVQLCVIDNEICFVKKLTPVAGGYRLDGLISGRAGTPIQGHSTGAGVFIITRDALRALQHPLISPNANLYVKSQPQGISLGDVDPTFKWLAGVAQSPPPVSNIQLLSGTTHVPDPITAVNATDNWIKVDGIHMAKYHPGSRVFVDGNPEDGLYHVYRSVQDGGGTRIYLVENIDSGFTVAGTVGVAAGTEGTYVAGEDLTLTFDYGVRDAGGAAPGEIGFGEVVPADSNGVSLKVPHEGRFRIRAVKPNGDTAREWVIDTDYPSITYSAADRNSDFGVTDPPTFNFSVSNENVTMKAWTQSRKIRLVV